MKVLYWQYYFTPPGSWGNRRSYDLARYWKAQGLDVWILAGGTYFSPVLKARLKGRRCFRTPEGVPVVYLPAPYHQRRAFWGRVLDWMRFSVWSAALLWRWRRKEVALIATVPPPFLVWLAWLRKKLWGFPYAVELYDAWPTIPEVMGAVPVLLRRPLRWLSHLSYREASLCVALSPTIREALSLDHAHLSYNGTRTSLFRRRSLPPFLPFRVVYAGTFGRVNHLSFLLEVAQRLRDYPAIEFWLVGDGAEKPFLVEKARPLSRVHFLNPVPVEEVPYYLSACHIGVSTVLPVPVLETNSANKFYDYLATGLVVGLNYGGWQADLVERAACGFSAPTAEGFAEGILRYYWDRRAWERAADRARRLAEMVFDRRRLAQELVPLLERAFFLPNRLS